MALPFVMDNAPICTKMWVTLHLRDLAEVTKVTYLNIDVNLWAWVELSEDGGFKGLFQVKTHLAGLAIAVWSSFPLCCAERGHAVLAVNNCSVMKGFTSGPSNLKKNSEGWRK